MRVDALRLTGAPQPGYLLGEGGALLLHWTLAPSEAVAAALAADIEAAIGHPSLGFAWGGAGAMKAALVMYERTGEGRWLDLVARHAGGLCGKPGSLRRDGRLLAVDPRSLWRGRTAAGRPSWLRRDRRRALAGASHLLSAGRYRRGGTPPPDRPDPGRDRPMRGRPRQLADVRRRHRRPLRRAPHPSALHGCAGHDQRPGGAARRSRDRRPVPGRRRADLGGGAGRQAARPLPRRPRRRLRLPETVRPHRRRGLAHPRPRLRRPRRRPGGPRQGRTRPAPCSVWTGDLGLALYLADCITGASAFPMQDVF